MNHEIKLLVSDILDRNSVAAFFLKNKNGATINGLWLPVNIHTMQLCFVLLIPLPTSGAKMRNR